MAPRNFFRHTEQAAQRLAQPAVLVPRRAAAVGHITDPRERVVVDRPVLLSVQDAADRLSVSRRTIYRCINADHDPLPVTHVRALLRIHEFELYAWAARQGQAQPQRWAVVGGRK